MSAASAQNPNGQPGQPPSRERGLFTLRTVVVCLGALFIGTLAGALAYAESGSWPHALMTVLGFTGGALMGLHQIVDRP
ncbi:hypothetical protein [Streptomyces tibetensis]|uniref:Integral membrane protein n=1 Tax=Streptomyces tibetensis TaxID=2382123 RepID=A0ABW6MT57_9ACTN